MSFFSTELRLWSKVALRFLNAWLKSSRLILYLDDCPLLKGSVDLFSEKLELFITTDFVRYLLVWGLGRVLNGLTLLSKFRLSSALNWRDGLKESGFVRVPYLPEFSSYKYGLERYD